ncbi:hypothetical protein ASF96_08460 [Microbacterium sp. Leaf179]|nr:hypothetical protein ASF96_08460 [Microbacterium sp. Leaf179]
MQLEYGSVAAFLHPDGPHPPQGFYPEGLLDLVQVIGDLARGRMFARIASKWPGRKRAVAGLG